MPVGGGRGGAKLAGERGRFKEPTLRWASERAVVLGERLHFAMDHKVKPVTYVSNGRP